MENKYPHPNLMNADLTRAVAISLVIILHMSANSFASMGDYWIVSLVYDSFTRSCVPLFFMLSGALLLNKNEPASIFYKKRLSKLVIPLIFWSYIYLLYRKFYVGETELSLSPMALVNGPVYYHLWFLYSIISVYIFIPMLRYYSLHASSSVKIIVISFWFISQSLQPFASTLGFNLYIGVDIGFISRFIGFALLGELLANYKYKINNSYLTSIFILSTVSTAYATYQISTTNGIANETWFQYHSPFVITSAICLFLITIRAKTKTNKLTQSISKYSFGIYFVHIIIMQQIVVRFFFTPELFNSPWLILLIPASSSLCIALSLILCISIGKIPLLNKTL